VIKTKIAHANFWANIMISPWKEALRETLNKLWWKHVPGSTVTMPWPRGPVEVGPNSGLFDGFKNEIPQTVESADPNDHYRPWLEKNIGRQGWDWDWKWEQASYYPGRYGARVTHDAVVVRARRRYREQLAEFKLLFG
jgi:hypothetical protein